MSNSWLTSYVTMILCISTKKIWCSKFQKKDAIYQDMFQLTQWDLSGLILPNLMIIYIKLSFWTIIPSKVRNIMRFGAISNQNSWWHTVSFIFSFFILCFLFRALQLCKFLRSYPIQSKQEFDSLNGDYCWMETYLWNALQWKRSIITRRRMCYLRENSKTYLTNVPTFLNENCCMWS